MTQSQVAIIGTGLIGASIGLNLMGRKDRNYLVVGADRDRTASRAAKKLGAIDKEVGSIEEAVEGAGLVILAVPVLGARRILQDVARYVKPGVIVTDTCSTKADIMKWAEEFLPEGVHFVGGHPMAGKEKSGPGAAAIELFRDASWAITPSPRAAEGAVQVVLGLIESVGAHPLYIDAAEHDQYAAAISHVPILVSVALFRMARDSAGWEDLSLLAGPGFRDLTRLASGDATMAHDILGTNRDAVLHWLRRFRDEIDTVASAVEAGGEPVANLLASTQLDRDVFISNPPMRRRPEGVEAPSAQDAMGRLFVGAMYDKIKQAGKGPSEGDRTARQARSDRELRRKLGIEDDSPDR